MCHHLGRYTLGSPSADFVTCKYFCVHQGQCRASASQNRGGNDPTEGLILLREVQGLPIQYCWPSSSDILLEKSVQL